MIHRIVSIAVLTCCLANHSAAEEVETAEESAVDSGEELEASEDCVVDLDEELEAGEDCAVDFDEELDEVEIDVEGSIGDADEKRQGLRVNGDLRTSYVYAGDDVRDVALGDTDVLRARWRIRSTFRIADNLRGGIRLAGICSTEGCDPDFVLQPDTPTQTSLDEGQITIDSLFLHWFRSDRFDVAVGRMETKFVARGGVYSKSLDRNNSNNLRINWTDGIHATLKARNGWESHVIAQYNSDDGRSSNSRPPLDFSSSESRVSYFFGFENLQSKRAIIQRAIDITYMPSSLLVDGQVAGPIEDYWGIVARTASRWPVRSEGWRIRLSSEVGYAPNTATKFASGIIGTGNADGFAWNVTASLMDFMPNHSIGINFAMTEAGWLLSPQYRDNERLMEVRYMWRPTNRLTVDIRGRWRDELHERIVANPDRDQFDFYARLTWSFDLIE
jgi:hypothetical protein